MYTKHLVVIEGPTASGKTNAAVELALKWKTVVVSADSRQFYSELSIGTAKPTHEEMKGVPHFFIDSHSVLEEVSAGKFADLASRVLEEQFKRHDIIVLVGGSGMFIDALCEGLHPIPVDAQLREALTAQVKENGLVALLNELKKSDIQTFQTIDKRNPVRVIRAVEAIRLLGKPLSEVTISAKKKPSFSVNRYVLDHPREMLYGRINSRVDLMMEIGLLQEVKDVYQFRHLKTLKTVGYSELFDFLEGKCTIDDAVSLIKQHTRNYAKRQLTWFRRHKDATWLSCGEVEQPAQWIFENVRSKYGT
jgi:tRNA dimethylallyltransferase